MQQTYDILEIQKQDGDGRKLTAVEDGLSGIMARPVVPYPTRPIDCPASDGDLPT